MFDENGGTLLTITEGDYAFVAHGERKYTEAFNSAEGWNLIFNENKK